MVGLFYPLPYQKPSMASLAQSIPLSALIGEGIGSPAAWQVALLLAATPWLQARIQQYTSLTLQWASFLVAVALLMLVEGAVVGGLQGVGLVEGPPITDLLLNPAALALTIVRMAAHLWQVHTGQPPNLETLTRAQARGRNGLTRPRPGPPRTRRP
jgi:hypothetical protein